MRNADRPDPISKGGAPMGFPSHSFSQAEGVPVFFLKYILKRVLAEAKRVLVEAILFPERGR